MQRPTDTLRAEHAVVGRGLAALAAIGSHVRAGGALPAADVATLLRFLREFVVPIHMRKEAEVVWPAVALRADETAAACIGDLCRLHTEVTELVHALVLFWEPAGDLLPEERAGFAATVDAITTRMQRMQRLEEDELFAACDAAVPADDQLDWNERFAELAAGREDHGAWARRIAGVAGTWLH